MNSQLIEIASWRMVSELIRRAPRDLTVMETHPCDGQYDCLSVIHKSAGHVADFNRQGSFHVMARVDGREFRDECYPIWEEIDKGRNPREVLDHVCDLIGLDVPKKLPSSTPEVLVYRFVAAFLAAQAFGLDQWECRNGVQWSYEGYFVNTEWFSEFPLMKGFPKNRPGTAADRDIACGYWFMQKNESPVLCVGKTGEAWDRERSISIPDLYRKSRSIWTAVAEIGGGLLP